MVGIGMATVELLASQTEVQYQTSKNPMATWIISIMAISFSALEFLYQQSKQGSLWKGKYR